MQSSSELSCITAADRDLRQESSTSCTAEANVAHTMHEMLAALPPPQPKHGIFSRCSSGAAAHSCLQICHPHAAMLGNQRRLLTRKHPLWCQPQCGVSRRSAQLHDIASQGKTHFNRAPSFNAEPLGDRNIPTQLSEEQSNCTEHVRSRCNTPADCGCWWKGMLQGRHRPKIQPVTLISGGGYSSEPASQLAYR